MNTAPAPFADAAEALFAGEGEMRDTTGRVLAERAREAARAEGRAAEARLRQVFGQAPAANLITQGPDHVPTVVNPRYPELVGSRDLLGQPARDSFSELDGQGFFERKDRVYPTGEAFVCREMSIRLDRGEAEEGVIPWPARAEEAREG